MLLKRVSFGDCVCGTYSVQAQLVNMLKVENCNYALVADFLFAVLLS